MANKYMYIKCELIFQLTAIILSISIFGYNYDKTISFQIEIRINLNIIFAR